MATEVTLPPIADGVDKADILAVLVKEGDEIEAEATICEVEAEKATASVPSPAKGRVAKVLVKAGDKVAVGQALILLDEPGTAAGKSTSPVVGAMVPAPAAEPAPQEPAPQEPPDAERIESSASVGSASVGSSSSSQSSSSTESSPSSQSPSPPPPLRTHHARDSRTGPGHSHG